MAEPKSNALQNAIDVLDKKYGKGTTINFEDTATYTEFVDSGSLNLNNAMGGGYPKGRIVEIYGPESSGKSTLSMSACVKVQELGKIAVYIDGEQAFDRSYGEQLGLDYSKDKWIFSQPTCGEENFDIVEQFLSVPEVGIIVVDSVATMIPQAELDGDFGDSKMGLHARLMSQGMRKLVSKISKSDCIVIFINQTRDKIGVVFGNPETTTGGNALKFYASIRLRINKTATDKDSSGDAVLNRVKVKVIKNKVAPPFREAEFGIIFGKGIDRIGEVLDISVAKGIIKKSGSWFSYGETKLGQGADGVKLILSDNPELVDEIMELIKTN